MLLSLLVVVFVVVVITYSYCIYLVYINYIYGKTIYARYRLSIYNNSGCYLVSRRIIEGPIVKVGTRSGNGGHVIIPEHWIGKKIRCSIIEEAEGNNSYSNNNNNNNKTQQHQPHATNKTIEDKFISRVAKEVGDNYITRPTRARATSSKGK